MANSISNIVQEALAGLKLIKKEIGSLNDEFAKASKNASQVFKGGGNIAEYEKRISSLEKALAKMHETSAKGAKIEEKRESSLQKQINLLAKNQNAVEASSKSEVAAYKRRLNAFKKEERQLKRTQGLYNRVQRGINSVKQRYRELAVRKELNGKLSQKEIIELGKLEAKLNKYQTALKKVDAGMGVYTRSVGSYGKAFDSLGFSVAQITRESPAFLNSLNTGFMAISNNLPILVDEINKLRIANVQLAKDGKPTVNILKRLGAAIFSWQSLISAAIVALTVFGPKLIEIAQNTFSASNAADRYAKALVSLEEETVNTVGKLRGLVAVSQDVTRTDEERIQAIKEINKIQPDMVENISLEKQALEDLNDVVEDYISLMINKARVAEIESEIGDKVVENIQLQRQLNKLSIDEDDIRVKKYLELRDASDVENLSLKEKQERIKDLDAIYLSLNPRQREYIDLTNKISNNEAEINKVIQEYLSSVDIKIDKEEKSKNSSEKLAESLVKNSEPAFEKTIKSLKRLQSRVAVGSGLWNFYENQIRLVELSLKALRGEIKRTLYDAEDAQKRLEERLIKGFRAKQDGKKDEDILGFREYFLSIVPIAQNALQLIADAQRNATRQALADLEKQKDIAIQFAGESADARAAIEEQYEERRRAIQKKQAESEKKQAIFSIALSTAQAVVAALTSKPPNIPLSIAVGAIGLAQGAIAASTPIPEFFRGTMNAPEGLALVDEKRPEVHTDRHGNIKSFGEGKANYRYLERGDKIYKSREEYFSKEIESNIPFNSAMMAYQMAIHNNNQEALSKADFNRGIDKLMSKETSVVNINKAGFTASVISGNAKKNKMNNILRLKKGIV